MGNAMKKGNIPVLLVQAKNLPSAWEKSLESLYKNGCDIKTEYDKSGDPPSKDSSMTIVIEDPLSEPLLHRDIPAGLEDLQEYVLEVTEGIKDHWVRNPDDPDDTRWEYTYHQRLFKYTIPEMENFIDQIDIMAEKVSEVPYTRRAQAITWKVWEDNTCYDPPCLQSIWCRMLKGEGNKWFLNMNIRFRSNDAYKAAFMNMFAFIQLQKLIADKISGRSGREIRLGRYAHQADSYHIYGSSLQDFRERFMKNLETRSFEERTYRYTDMKFFMDQAVPGIRAKVLNFKL